MEVLLYRPGVLLLSVRTTDCKERQSFHLRFQVAIDLFPFSFRKPVSQTQEQFLYLGIIIGSGIDVGDNLYDQLLAVQAQLIPLNRLLFINAEQILLKDIFGQGRPHLCHTLFGKETFILDGRVRQQMDVGMMALIVKGSIPFQMIHGDLQAVRQGLRLRPKHIPPSDAGIETPGAEK